ncbi:hypothetical protein [Streptomyces albicerus]
MPDGLLYPVGGLADHLQQALPDTRVVKTLDTMFFRTPPITVGV